MYYTYGCLLVAWVHGMYMYIHRRIQGAFPFCPGIRPSILATATVDRTPLSRTQLGNAMLSFIERCRVILYTYVCTWDHRQCPYFRGIPFKRDSTIYLTICYCIKLTHIVTILSIWHTSLLLSIWHTSLLYYPFDTHHYYIIHVCIGIEVMQDE